MLGFEIVPFVPGELDPPAAFVVSVLLVAGLNVKRLVEAFFWIGIGLHDIHGLDVEADGRIDFRNVDFPLLGFHDGSPGAGVGTPILGFSS